MRKILKMILILVAAAAIFAAIAFVVSTDNLSQFGAPPSGERLERVKRSPHYDGERFVNEYPATLSFGWNGYKKMLSRWFFGKEVREPDRPLPIVQLDSTSLNSSTPSGLRAVWLGHSTVLIEIDGCWFLTDPVWSKRCSPSSLAGPKRFHPVPIALEDLPKLDAVLISHDHYDHLDKEAVTELAKTGVKFFVPLGVGAHFDKWNIDPSQVIESDWWEEFTVDGTAIRLTATPARHFSGRGWFGPDNPSLWLGWSITGPDHRVYFCGDTGPQPGFVEIGERLGPFDLTILKAGAYDEQWPKIHLTPEQSVEVHRTVKGDVMLPVHWGTFNLSMHPWFEPPERVAKAAADDSLRIVIPKPGQIFEIADPPPVDFWWREYIKTAK